MSYAVKARSGADDVTADLVFPGMRVGLLGGSFNPAHDGHRHISLTALRRLRLDQVWWLVSPQNPLKNPDDYAQYDERLAHAAHVAAHPRIQVSNFEQRYNLQYTHKTLDALLARRPAVSFVWMMGADNLATFHHWEHWRRIVARIPIAVFARPGSQARALQCPAAQYMAPWRLDAGDAGLLAARPAPAWIYVNETFHPASSTSLRAHGALGRTMLTIKDSAAGGRRV